MKSTEIGETSMTMYELFTVVLAHDSGPKAVLPFDANEHEDEGMLVYSSEEAAKASCEHQKNLYDIDCIPMRLVDYIGYTTGSLPWPPY